MLIALQLGGSVFHLREPKDYPLLAWPIHPFDEFLAPPNVPPDFQIDVTVVPHLPELETGPLRFDAGQGCWKLFESDAGFVIESLSPMLLQPRARALVSHDYRTIRAWVLPEMHLGQVGWSPMHLFNPIVEVCLLSRLALDGGLLLHAAGLTIQEEGYIFTGNSGTGKSTIAQFFADRGALVLSDERLIIRKIADDVLFYGTPWVGSGNMPTMRRPRSPSSIASAMGRSSILISPPLPAGRLARTPTSVFPSALESRRPRSHTGNRHGPRAADSLPGVGGTQIARCRRCGVAPTTPIRDRFTMKTIASADFLDALSTRAAQARRPEGVTFE